MSQGLGVAGQKLELHLRPAPALDLHPGKPVLDKFKFHLAVLLPSPAWAGNALRWHEDGRSIESP